MTLQKLRMLSERLGNSPQMPLLFLGHGSPMNALLDNQFTESWKAVGQNLPTPSAILCISAHWETRGTYVTAMENPRTIHDFYNFPKALYDIEYPAEGDPQLATDIQALITDTHIHLDHEWGLDHGAWSVIKFLYPNADIPVLQLSLDRSQSPRFHYDLAKELATLRKKGVLILGSGNIVHNLRAIDRDNPNGGYDWAEEAKSSMRQLIESREHQRLINYHKEGSAFERSIPTNEHFLPLLYILGLEERGEEIFFFNDLNVMGSLAMTSMIVYQ